MKLKRVFFIVIGIILFLVIALFFIRLFSERQVDDVSPDMNCEDSILKKADVFYVVPDFKNKSITDNKEWCNKMLAMNKTLALHGVYHTYNEFSQDRASEYLKKGVSDFKLCFNQIPIRFKPPQLAISDNNKRLILENNMQLDLNLNQLFHKVYHCNNSGRLSNKFIDWF
jgi:predicted deacetylase